MRMMPSLLKGVFLTGGLFLAPVAWAAQTNPRQNEHQTLEKYLGCKATELSIKVAHWQHWTSSERPLKEIEKELRDEVKGYVAVTAFERERMSHSVSLLGYFGKGSMTTPSGEFVHWSQESSFLTVTFPNRVIKGEVVVINLAPPSWLDIIKSTNEFSRSSSFHWPLDIDSDLPKIYILGDSSEVPVTITADKSVVWKGIVPKSGRMPNIHEAGIPEQCRQACTIEIQGGTFKSSLKLDWKKGNALVINFGRDGVVFRQHKEPVGFQ